MKYVKQRMSMRSGNARYSADPGVGRASGYARSGIQITWFGMTSGSPLGDRAGLRRITESDFRCSGRQVQLAPVVELVRTMLWTWGRGRPWGLVWCSKEAMTQCWGLTVQNRVRPVPCMHLRTA